MDGHFSPGPTLFDYKFPLKLRTNIGTHTRLYWDWHISAPAANHMRSNIHSSTIMKTFGFAIWKIILLKLSTLTL